MSDVTLVDDEQRMECEDKARILETEFAICSFSVELIGNYQNIFPRGWESFYDLAFDEDDRYEDDDREWF